MRSLPYRRDGGGHDSETLEIAGTVVVVRGVPADVCQQCGETYTDETTTRQIEGIVERARLARVGVIQEYQAGQNSHR